MVRRIVAIIGLLFFLCQFTLAQEKLETRFKKIYVGTAIQLDSLTILPSSLKVLKQGKTLDTNQYTFNAENSQLIFKEPINDTLFIKYSVFKQKIFGTYFHKDPQSVLPNRTGLFNPFIYKANPKQEDAFSSDGLNKAGSIARGISFGNNQNVVVNSNLNLQLSGKLTDKVEVLAAITDDNVPFQPEGNTQQLQEFDKVFIQLNDASSKLIAGDFQLSRPNSYFMNYFKRAQGGQFSNTYYERTKSKDSLQHGFKNNISFAGAVSKGKWNRMIVQGIEGNQGPYRLVGAENELFIVVLSGTEKVYIDGQLLTRGQENDYVIDYNTSEITFTAKRLITKDRRIVIEFQYSDKNYARSLYALNEDFIFDKGNVFFNVYSEQDQKNKPLQQTLNAEEKEILFNAGDDPLLTLAKGADSVGYRTDMVLYAKRDSTVNGILYNDVYVFSNHPDSAFYRLSFSKVGEGNGDYVQSTILTNGRVYKWVAPIDGVKQGCYEPIIQLIAPKKRQMFTTGGNIKLNKRTKLQVEGALSSLDKNTFSKNDSNDDNDYGFKSLIENTLPLGNSDSSWNLVSNLNFEQVNKNFNAIERFRSVEFDRDWNIRGRAQQENQSILGVGIGLRSLNYGVFDVNTAYFREGAAFSGLRNKLDANLRWKNFTVQTNSSATQTNDALNSTDFLRSKGSIGKKLGPIILQLKTDSERNLFKLNASDSLLANSYQFSENTLAMSNADSSKTRYSLSYVRRNDWREKNNQLSKFTFAEGVGLSFDVLKWKNINFKTNSSYRKLSIIDSTLGIQNADNTILNRIENGFRLWKGLIQSNTFYEIGSGLELRKEYAFIQVAPGQGSYAWKDYNENGLKEINEFELSPFADQAQYIKTFTPTNQYVKAYSNQFNQSLNITPALLLNNPKGLNKFISLWSNQSNVRLERKTSDNSTNEAYNPFYRNINDSLLQSMNSIFRNTLFFNRTGFVFGADYTWQDSRNKLLLVNGFDSKQNISHTLKTRYNINRSFTFNTENILGNKISNSQLLSSRNYSIGYYSLEPKLSYQYEALFKISIAYRYSEKYNHTMLDDSSHVFQNNITTEIKYNKVNKGSWSSRISLIALNYLGELNSPLGYEMLEGLNPGINYTWNLTYQQNLTQSLQLSISYDGRKTETSKAVHIGNVALRAIF